MNTSSLEEFQNYKLAVLNSVNQTKRRIDYEKNNREFIKFNNYPINRLKSEIERTVQGIFKQSNTDIKLSLPPSHIKGDFALEVFSLAKTLRKNPNQIASEITEKLNQEKSELIEKTETFGPFVNIETNKKKYYRETLNNILQLGMRYGESDINAGKTVIIDFSSPNIAKPIGVGHLRSTIIGQALANIYHETGYSVVRDNHLGDWGTQFGSLIYAYEKWGDENKISKNPINELKNLYVKFHQFSQEHPEAKEEARELFNQLENHNPEMIKLWKRFRDYSIKDFEKVYDQLGIKFDTYIGESYFNEDTDQIVKDCLEKNICRKDPESEAVVVDQHGNIPSFLLRKQDGSSLYISRDLAALKYRINTFKPDSIVYVVGSEQNLNFVQLFTLAKIGQYLPENIEVKHIDFGMVLRDGKKMSTRRGTLIELEDLMSQSINKSKQLVLQKNPNFQPERVNEVANMIGIGAILYNDLRQSRTKNISFDWDRMLNLEGGSAVYLQYSYVRIISILDKLAKTFGQIDMTSNNMDQITSFSDEIEFNLAKKLTVFPEVIKVAQENDSPHHICTYLEELAIQFNSFYNQISLIKTEDLNLRSSRIKLCQSVAIVIKKGLALLSIQVPDKM